MEPLLTLLAILAVAFVVAVAMSGPFSAWRRFHGSRLVTCPETQHPAAVEVNARHLVLTALVGRPVLRLKSCSRWPEKQDCGQACIAQIEEAPEDCLIRTLVTNWYRDKSCVLCASPIGEMHWHDHPPALRGPDGTTFEWSEAPPESLPELLASHEPVCWNCHVVETFRRKLPERVVERPRGADH